MNGQASPGNLTGVNMVADIVFVIVIVALALPGLVVLVFDFANSRRSTASATDAGERPTPVLFKPKRGSLGH